VSDDRSRHASARDERYAARLESFGDIVIGFSLAQLALSLVFPAHLTVLTLLPELSAFAWTFGMTAWLWTLYRRIGEDYFAPRPASTALYVAGLAGVVLLILGVQLVMHYGPLPGATSAEIDIAVIFYFAVLAATLGIVGAQFAVGVRARGAGLDPELRRAGTLAAFRLIVMAAFVAVAIALLPGRGIAGTAILFPAMLGGGIAGRLTGAWVARRSAPG